jgi:hypothetical protein
MIPAYFYCVLRQPPKDGSDPGVIEEGWFIVKDGIVLLTDPEGVPKPGEENRRPLGKDGAKAVAVRLLKAKSNRRPSKPFNRPLRYPKLAY